MSNPLTLIMNINGGSISYKMRSGSISSRCSRVGANARGSLVSIRTNNGSPSGYFGFANHWTTACSDWTPERRHVNLTNLLMWPYTDWPSIFAVKTDPHRGLFHPTCLWPSIGSPAVNCIHTQKEWVRDIRVCVRARVCDCMCVWCAYIMCVSVYVCGVVWWWLVVVDTHTYMHSMIIRKRLDVIRPPWLPGSDRSPTLEGCVRHIPLECSHECVQPPTIRKICRCVDTKIQSMYSEYGGTSGVRWWWCACVCVHLCVCVRVMSWCCVGCGVVWYDVVVRTHLHPIHYGARVRRTWMPKCQVTATRTQSEPTGW